MIEVLRHGNEKYIFTCKRCDCKWLAYKNDIHSKTVYNAGEPFELPRKVEDAKTFKAPFCNCPECGQDTRGEKVIPQPHRYA